MVRKGSRIDGVNIVFAVKPCMVFLYKFKAPNSTIF